MPAANGMSTPPPAYLFYVPRTVREQKPPWVRPKKNLDAFGNAGGKNGNPRSARQLGLRSSQLNVAKGG